MNHRLRFRPFLLVTALLAATLSAMLFSCPMVQAAGDRKLVQWDFATGETPAQIHGKLHEMEKEIVARYHWRVDWKASDVEIVGKLFDACLRVDDGRLVVRMQLEPVLYPFEKTIRKAFEKELRKHLALL